ncbi:MAG: hypothetical protein ACYST5_12930, partial [Planctomycetota bacterium]
YDNESTGNKTLRCLSCVDKYLSDAAVEVVITPSEGRVSKTRNRGNDRQLSLPITAALQR